MAARALSTVVFSLLALPAFGAIAPPAGLARNLQPAAQALGLTLPTSLSSEKQAELNVYRSMPADKMEKCYLGALKADHAKDVTDYAIHQNAVENSQLKQYVTQTLPILREHAQHVNTVAQAKGITGDASMTDTSDLRREVK